MEWNGVCPWCGGDRLYWNDEKDVYICFRVGCGASGRGRPPVEAWLGWAKRPNADKPQKARLPSTVQPLPRQPQSRLDWRIHKYLTGHHISWKNARSYGLLKNGTNILFPFWNNQQELIFFQERSSVGPKYFSNVSGEKSGFIFFTRKRFQEIVLVESAFSALRVRPFAPAGALLGKHTTEQIKNLIRLSRRKRCPVRKVLVMLDSDAWAASVDLRSRLFSYFSEIYVSFLRTGDPCDLSNDELELHIEEALGKRRGTMSRRPTHERRYSSKQ